MKYTKIDAEISVCGKYRYMLLREWEPRKPKILFICLNPSTADDKQDDPTIRRIVNYSKLWGYGGVYVANLFAYRATSPNDMKKYSAPVGDDNDKWLTKLSNKVDLIIAAWGNHGSHMKQSEHVIKMFSNLHYLKLTNSNQPSHPLMLKKNLTPKAL